VRRALLLGVVLGAAACGLAPLGPRDERGPAAAVPAFVLPGRIVVAEHAGRGGHLLFVDERGRRVRSLTAPPADDSIDLTPAFAPDGRSIVFSSSRGSVGRAAGLWLVPADGSAPPRRLTGPEQGIDFQPAFAPDGRAIAYTSSVGPGHGVWVLPLDALHRPGAPRLVAADALRPAWSHRGDLLAFTRQVGARDAPELWLAAPDGSDARKLVDGAGAAFAPDDRRIAFVAGAPGRADADLWLVDADGAGAHRVVDDPIGDEANPRFSADGRFLFAEAVVRDGDGKPIFPSIVYVDLAEARPRLRALQDPSPGGWTSLAVAPVPLDAEALLRGPGYEESLRRALVAIPPSR
jgi:Tol biopolymer transport system component